MYLTVCVKTLEGRSVNVNILIEEDTTIRDLIEATFITANERYGLTIPTIDERDRYRIIEHGIVLNHETLLSTCIEKFNRHACVHLVPPRYPRPESFYKIVIPINNND